MYVIDTLHHVPYIVMITTSNSYTIPFTLTISSVISLFSVIKQDRIPSITVNPYSPPCLSSSPYRSLPLTSEVTDPRSIFPLGVKVYYVSSVPPYNEFKSKGVLSYLYILTPLEPGIFLGTTEGLFLVWYVHKVKVSESYINELIFP